MEKLIHLQNNIVSYYDKGEGEIVILLHGFGEDKSIWENQIFYLQNKYRVIAPDLPGVGKSTSIIKSDISIDDFADWLHQFLQQFLLNPDYKFVLLGHSMGGYIALSFAKHFSDKLLGFGLIHSTAIADSIEKKKMRKRGIETIKKYGAFNFLKNTIPNLFGTNFKEKNFQIVEELIQQAKILSEKTLVQYYFAMMNREDTTGVLSNSSIPVLFIIGTEDIAVPMQDVLQQCHLPSKSQVNILENVGHMGIIELPHTVNDLIENFIENSIN